MAFRKLRKLYLVLASALIVGVLAAGCGSGGGSGSDGGDGGGGGSPGEGETLTIGYINWDENVANANLTEILLEEELGYEVELQQADPGPLFQGVASGDLDAFQDVWLPGTHEEYWDEYQDEVVDLGTWYEGEATLGVGVPDYVDAQSVSDLADNPEEYGGEIVGIEAGSGVNAATEDEAIPEYGLEDDFQLVTSSTPAMLSELDSAIQNEEPIAVTAWKPHWMFTEYDMRYLEDPEGAMGAGEELSSIANEDLEENAPEAFAFLSELTLNEEQLGELENEINNAEETKDGVRAWMEDNRDVVEPWVEAAEEA